MIDIAENECDHCGTCVAVCPVDCISLDEKDIYIEHSICINCDLCIKICPIEVLSQN